MKGGGKEGVFMVAKVLSINHFHEKENKSETKNPGIIKKPGSNKLYVDIYPNGIRVQKSSRLEDTPENRVALQKSSIE